MSCKKVIARFVALLFVWIGPIANEVHRAAWKNFQRPRADLRAEVLVGDAVRARRVLEGRDALVRLAEALRHALRLRCVRSFRDHL
jgi:hypothetical protein